MAKINADKPIEKVQDAELTSLKQKYEENIVELKTANLEREKYLKNKLEGKNSVVQYILHVLRKSEDKLGLSWAKLSCQLGFGCTVINIWCCILIYLK